MQNGAKFALGGTAVLLLAVGGQLLYLHHRNAEPGPETKVVDDGPKMTDDDQVRLTLKHLRPDSLKDARELVGKTIWVSAGGQLDYYPAAGHHAEYGKRAGTLPGAQAMQIKDVFEQVPPKGRATARIPAGQKHVLLSFTMPDAANPKALYATPVGYYEGGLYTFFNDDIFYYDDPRILYKYWGPDVWAHIEKREVVPGMSLTQALMAYGQVFTPGSRSNPMSPDQTAEFDNDGHPVRIVFEKNKAVRVTPESK